MKEWIDVTESFSERQRHYKNMYLEICEVCDEKIEVSLFLSEEDPCEIYFSYGRMYGIIYVERENAYLKKEAVKSEILAEYQKNEQPSSKFVNDFCEKHKVCLPSDIFFDATIF